MFEDTAPLVEGMSIDEAFLDVRGLGRSPGTPAEIAGRLRREVLERVGLPITVGVARPSSWPRWPAAWRSRTGCWWCRPTRELAFLHPLPVERLWGVGPATAAKLHRSGITTVGEVARADEADAGDDARAGPRPPAARAGAQPRPAAGPAGSRRRSIGSQRALGRAAAPARGSTRASSALVDRVTRRMRAAGRVGRTVMLRLRFDDFTRATRSHTLPGATAQTQAILRPRAALLAAARPLIERRGLTLVGIAVTNLEDGQRSAGAAVRPPQPGRARRRAGQVRDRYGSAAVIRAASLGRDQRSPPPLLPD